MNGPRGRILALVDGFNVYFAIRSNPEWRRAKWLDYRKLCQSVLPAATKLVKVVYFTALYPDDPEGNDRHRLLIRALRSVGVETVLGKFKRRDRKCRLCRQWYAVQEEKETDVNIAVGLYRYGLSDTFDTALLVTGDTDLLPAIRNFREDFPGKRVGVFLPPGRASEELKKASDFYMRMRERHLRTCQFPDRVSLSDGTVLERPANWT